MKQACFPTPSLLFDLHCCVGFDRVCHFPFQKLQMWSVEGIHQLLKGNPVTPALKAGPNNQFEKEKKAKVQPLLVVPAQLRD